MIWSILVASCATEAAKTSRPEDGAHAHRAGFAGGVERAAAQRRVAVIGETAADRHHLAMRGRVMGRPPQITPARNDRAVAHDHRPEGKIASAGLVERHAHEPYVVSGSRGGGLGERAFGRDGGGGKRGQEETSAWSNDRVPAHAVFMHVNPSASVGR